MSFEHVWPAIALYIAIVVSCRTYRDPCSVYIPDACALPPSSNLSRPTRFNNLLILIHFQIYLNLALHVLNYFSLHHHNTSLPPRPSHLLPAAAPAFFSSIFRMFHKVFSSAARFISKMPRAPPIVTATIQATALASLSNILAQLLDCYRKELPLSLDVIAFLRFLISTVLTAPPNFYWQAWLERTFPGRLPAEDDRTRSQASMEDGIGMSEGVGGQGNDSSEKRESGVAVESEGDRKLREGSTGGKLNWKNTWTKWFIDCITMGALMNTVAFFLIMGTLKGKPASEIRHDIVHVRAALPSTPAE